MGRYTSPWNALPAEARARLRTGSQPRWIAPMLATLTDERFSREGWLFEPKWDGERCLVFRRGRELHLFSRNRILLNERYPEITTALQSAAELTPSSPMVKLSRSKTASPASQSCKNACKSQHPSADLLRRVPVWLYLFDLLYLDRYDTRRVPLRYRKELLRTTFDVQGFVAVHGTSGTRGRSLLPTGVSQRLGGRDRKGWQTASMSHGEPATG